MAIKQYDRAMAELTTVLSGLYTCPSGKYGIVSFCQASNKDASDHTVDFTVASGLTDYYAAYNIEIAAQSSLAPFSSDLVLKAGDVLKAKADANSVIDVVLSVEEVVSGV